MQKFALSLLVSLILASAMPGWLLSHCEDEGARLVRFEDGSTEIRSWRGIEDLITDGTPFMDITDTADLMATTESLITPLSVPTKLRKEVDALTLLLHQKIDKTRMKTMLTKFSSFHTRYFRSQSGAQAADWLWDHLVEIAEFSKMKVTLERIDHEDWPQSSIIARLQMPGTPDISDDVERVVLSAHLDSTSTFLPMIMPAPGADDDGSGSATIVEAFRILAAHSLELKRPLEFMWYSAEEAGLLGSQAIVLDYQRRHVPAAVLHIDMDGYSGEADGRKPCMGIITDNTSDLLSDFIRLLAKRYSKLPIVETACGYACSDHASWNAGGYAAAALTESRFEDMNPNIHTVKDTVDRLDFDHMVEFVKVALAYALHMSDHLNPRKE